MLHIIKSEAGYQQAKSYLQKGDDVLFVESACYLVGTVEADKQWQCYFLKQDMDARGLMQGNDISAQVTDFNGFVELTERHIASTTWG
ncbi:DsrH/TusB family sulfur relay protein [Vibrio hangzhouensis]|uniref:DsrH/TusB family sulfur relay protein n=1 Tax=Vibrio hangzhouensis TaxID=462991 RepID=UPI001C95EDA7|nr:DsrH/TusB family sulfur relay protein [Vibrio hangzhouensis]MBY6198971.1 DsrH/TusB family sulfur relay protein [Vibrio hangzhouensis]